MKSIIDDLLYDTEKARLIYSFRRQVDVGPVLWNPQYHWTPWHSITIYKTKKGRYFEHDEDANKITPIEEDAARRIIKKLDPDTYKKIFKEKVEEA